MPRQWKALIVIGLAVAVMVVFTLRQPGDNHVRDRPDSQARQVASDEGTPPETPSPAQDASPQVIPGTGSKPTETTGEAELQPDQSAPANEPKPKRLPRLLEIGAETCIPCRMMQPILAELRREYAGKLQVDFIDVSKNPEEARKSSATSGSSPKNKWSPNLPSWG